jgi:hypothetical protein
MSSNAYAAVGGRHHHHHNVNVEIFAATVFPTIFLPFGISCHFFTTSIVG